MTARQLVLATLVAVPIAMNAVALVPEVLYPLPNVNDDAEHVLMTERASEAFATGENPLDVWVPQLELGFPQLLYYQHLAHLTVVAVDRVLFERLPIRTVFDLVRYLLLVTFPLTVLWSMRTMGFSTSAAAVGAAAASLLSGSFRYGFEYDSYIWRGLGLFTQIFGMHLAFIALALIERLIRTGRGVIVTAISCAALVLGHLIYAYMIGIGAVILALIGLRPSNAAARLLRLAAVGGIALVLTSYFVIPFFLQSGYVNISPYLEQYKYDGFGAPTVLGWLATGDLLDHGRLPMLTAMFALGLVVAIVRRDTLALRIAAIGAVMLALYFGRPTFGALIDLLPMHEGLLLHRFVGGFDLAAIPLIGVGGGFLFDQLSRRLAVRPAVLAGGVLLLLLAPALHERWTFYADNTTWLRQTADALYADADAKAVLDRIAASRPGRAYAGLRANWGSTLNFGIPFNSIHVNNLFADRGIDALAAPYRDASLNSDILWDFNDQDLASYRLFNVDYVVASHDVSLPVAFAVILNTPRYVLYAAPGGGYAQYVGIARRERFTTQAALFDAERAFVRAGDFADGSFVRFDYRDAGARAGDAVPVPACPRGQILSERVAAARFDLVAQCDTASAMILKVTYHPNWHVTIDGTDIPTYMVSPSFVGFDVPAGRHVIAAEYRSLPLKSVLFGVGVATLIALAALSFRRRRPSRADLRARTTAAVRAFGTRSWHWPLVAAGCAALMLLAVAALTPPITFNNGLGDDGQIYDQMVRGFRDHAPVQPAPPWVYRVAPAWIVAFIGVDTRLGFLLLNVIATIASAPLFVLFLRRFGIVGGRSFVALVWWLVLPMGLRWGLFYPALPDSIGFLLLLGLLLAAKDRRYVFFAAMLAVVALTRENLISLAPLPFFIEFRRGERSWPAVRRAMAIAAAAALPAALAFLWVRVLPPLVPLPVYPNWLASHRIDVNVGRITGNVDGHAWRYLFAAPLSLGLLFFLPLAWPRRTIAFLRREPEWIYFIGITLVLAVLGGWDDDRYLYVLTPLLAVLTFGLSHALFRNWWSGAALTAIHLAVVRFGWPVSGATEREYFQYSVAFMDQGRMWMLVVFVGLGFVAAWAVVRLSAGGRAAAARSGG
jgi:hypothetical protein